MKKIGLLIVFVILILSGVAQIYPVNLKCEYISNPEGIDKQDPRFCWQLISGQRGQIQTAYQIIVSESVKNLSKNTGEVWSSGKLKSDQSVQLVYNGKLLKSGTKYFWKVRVWDKNDKASAWSDMAYWSMGLLTKDDWQNAKWIAYKAANQWKQEWKQHKDSELNNLPANRPAKDWWPWFTGKDSSIFSLYEMPDPKYDPSPLFRKEFTLNKKLLSARLYVCGLGYFEAYLNGKKVGDHVLDPAWTNYEQRSMYVTFDVTDQLTSGKNVLGFMLGRGQYNPLCNDIWGLSKSAWIDQPKVIALLKLEYTDGSVTNVITDNSWKTSGGPIVYDDTRHGELYDARQEQKGWNAPLFSDSSWKNASDVDWNAPLVSQMIPPIRCFSPISPIKTFKKGDGITVYDIGQNIAGWAKVKLHGSAGAKVLVEYCETPSDLELLPNLTLQRTHFSKSDKNYQSFCDQGVNVRQQNGYILNGEGEETVECHFSYKGFQFIRISADKGVVIDQVEAIPVHTDVELAGEFSCSNNTINQLQKNAVTSLISNYHSVGTDCPHREKQGWTADNYMSSKAAMYNFNMASFYTKWLTDLAETQNESGGLGTVAPSTNYDKNKSTVWPAAIVFIPLDLWAFYADDRPMKSNLDVMNRFAKSSLLRQVEEKPEIINDVLGDWVAPLMVYSDTQRNNTMAPPEGTTIYGTASHFRIVKRISEIDRILGKEKESKEMDQWTTRIAKRFNTEFFDEKNSIYHGDKPTGYRQSANVVSLEYGLVSPENRKVVYENLIQDIHEKGDRLGTGFIGTASLMAYLPEEDPELAFKLVTQKNYPGWGYMIEQGANSMWETWDGDNSRNHPPFCLISEYFYKYLAGIQVDPENPGFKHFIIKPSIVGDLKFVNAYHDCLYGRIKSNWKSENGKFTMEVSVPVNTTATIFVPAKSASEVLESGQAASKANGLEFLREEHGRSVYKAGSGSYSFISKLNQL